MASPEDTGIQNAYSIADLQDILDDDEDIETTNKNNKEDTHEIKNQSSPGLPNGSNKENVGNGSKTSFLHGGNWMKKDKNEQLPAVSEISSKDILRHKSNDNDSQGTPEPTHRQSGQNVDLSSGSYEEPDPNTPFSRKPILRKGNKTKKFLDATSSDTSRETTSSELFENDVYDTTGSGSSTASVQRVSSDISGRYFVDGAEYRDVKEKRLTAIEGSTEENKYLQLYDTGNQDMEYMNSAELSLTNEYGTVGSWNKEGSFNAQRLKVLPDINPENMPKLRPISGLHQGPITDADIYSSTHAPISPNVREFPDEDFDDDDDVDSLGSSDFDSFDEFEESTRSSSGAASRSSTAEKIPKQDELTRKDSARRNSEPPSLMQMPASVMEKLKSNIALMRNPAPTTEDENRDDYTCVEVFLNLEKHPYPCLPPTPEGLTEKQRKRRFIVSSIISSEINYTESLNRLVDSYEKPLLSVSPRILNKKTIKIIFHKLRDILQCHNMFHIELAEAIRLWDKEEKIGNVFTASFSKAIVFEAYSGFVNNFVTAMETAKKNASNKQSFSDFLQQRMRASPDKLSLYGLMVKPVQRFPQFILLLQDLLKCTPQDHPDRLALQLALTELENLTHKLNETKRESENIHDVKKILSSMSNRGSSIKDDEARILVRQDDVVQLDGSAADESKAKERRLFLLSDQLICTNVITKETEAGTVEKFRFKWGIPVKDVEVMDTAISTTYKVKSSNGRLSIISSKPNKHVYSPWKKELDDLQHDLPVMEEVLKLLSQLRLDYDGLSFDEIFSITKNLQRAISQKSDLDRSIIQFSVPQKSIAYGASKGKFRQDVMRTVKNERSNSKTLYTFQVSSPLVKQEWLLQLQQTKLALDPCNNPGWKIPESEQAFALERPLFMKPLCVDVTRQATQCLRDTLGNHEVHCAVPVIIPSQDKPGVGIPHLWVCSGELGRAQVTVVALHTNQPYVVESFKGSDKLVICAEMVPGYATCSDPYAFHEDSVWMGTDDQSILVQIVCEESRRGPVITIPLPANPLCIQYLDHRVFVGLDNGTLMMINRDFNGIWEVQARQEIHLGEFPVTCLLPSNHDLWVACGYKVHVLTVTMHCRRGNVSHKVEEKCHEISSPDEGELLCIVKAGVGLLISLKNKPVIRIFHWETFQHLQDISIASVVHKTVPNAENLWEQVYVTCLLSCKGLLWIGTNCGCVLTLPLPRLEGVPQIKARASVAYHSHVKSVKFLLPMNCSSTKLQPPEHDMDNISYTTESMLSQTGDDAGDQPVMLLDGATESDTEEIPEYTKSEEFDFESPSKVLTLSDHNSRQGMYLDIEPTVRKAPRWVSTPNLLANTLQPSKEDFDVTHLYRNLLRGTENDPGIEFIRKQRNRRPLSEMPQHIVSVATSKVSKFTNSGVNARHSVYAKSKFSTLPVVKENTLEKKKEVIPVEEIEEDYEEVGPDREADAGELQNDEEDVEEEEIEEEDEQEENRVIMRNRKPSASKLFVPPDPIFEDFPSRNVVIVSGGEGHVNWFQNEPASNRYEDICLLLWQSRT